MTLRPLDLKTVYMGRSVRAGLKGSMSLEPIAFACSKPYRDSHLLLVKLFTLQKYHQIMASKGNHKSVSQLQKITRKNDRRYSNDMKDAVATFCHECDKVVFLSGLKDHIESEHQLSISEYCKFYRKPDTQLIRITYHRCRLCEKSLVLDKDKIIHHLKKCHRGERHG